MTSSVSRILVVAVVVMLASSMTVGAGAALASGDSHASDGTDGPVGVAGVLGGVVDQVNETASDALDKPNVTEEDVALTSDEEADTSGSEAPADDEGDSADEPDESVEPDESQESESGDDQPDQETETTTESTEEPTDDADESAPEGTNETDTEANGSVVDRATNALGETVENATRATEEGVTNATDRNDTAEQVGDDAVAEASSDEGTNDTDATRTNDTEGSAGLAGGLTGATTGAATETVDGAVGGLGNNTRATTGVVDETADGVTEGTTSTVERTGGEVTNATTGVESTTNDTVDAVAGESVVGEVTKAVVDGTVTTTNDVVENGTEATVRVVETTDAAREDLTRLVNETATAIERTTDEVTEGVDRSVQEVAGTVDASTEPATVGGTFPSEGAPVEAEQLPDEEWSDSTEPAEERPAERDVAEAEPENATAAAAPAEDDDGTPHEGTDPGAGGAMLGALLVAGAGAATRASVAASAGGAGAAATLPQLAFAMLREWLFRLALLAGYSRYDFEDPLENENRATLFETVEESPGINLTSLVEETGLAESTVRYHLRVLEHEGEVESAKVRGRRRYVPGTGADVELVAALEEDATKDVLEALLENEPATGTALAESLDRDKSTVSHHLSRLSEAGLVEREPEGPALMNSLCPEVRQALEPIEVHSSVQQHARADD